MKLTGLFRGCGKGQPPEALERWHLEAGSNSDDRQLSLIFASARTGMSRMNMRGLCMRRFFANMEIEGLLPLKDGERLMVGGAALEITPAKKECFDACPLVMEKTRCPLSTGCCFARVLHSGVVSVGDPVYIVRKAQ